MKQSMQVWIAAVAAVFCLSPTYAIGQNKFEVRIGTGGSQVLIEDDGPRDQDKNPNTIFFEDIVNLEGGKRLTISLRVSQTIVPGKSADLKLGPITIINSSPISAPVPVTAETILINSSKFVAPIGPPFTGRVHLSGRYGSAAKISKADIFLQGSVFPVGQLPRVIGDIDPPSVEGVDGNDPSAKFGPDHGQPDKAKKFDFAVERLSNFLQFSLNQADRIYLENSAVVSGYTAERIFEVNSTLDLDDGDTSDGICDIGSANPNHPNFPLRGICPLRAALTQSELSNDLTPLPNAIHFNIPGTGVPTIPIDGNVSFNRGSLGALRPVIIDGITQPSGLVVLDGSGAAEKDIADNPIVGLDLVGKDIEVRGLEITGFPSHGIQIRPTGAPEGGNNLIEGNFILNNRGDGVHIFEMPNNIVIDNFIRENVSQGISIADPDVDPNLDGKGNRLLGNFITMNGEMGIDLSGEANNQQAAPVLTSATSGSGNVDVEGTLNSMPGKTFTLQFFVNSECDPSGFGEGEDFIGSTEVMTDAGGSGNFSVSLPVNVAVGQFITATATDSDGNTSEFSQCVQISAATPADLIETLISQVENITSLNKGQKNSLISKLEAAQQSLARANRNAARGQLNAFINKVQALKRSGRLDAATADSLIVQAQAIINGI